MLMCGPSKCLQYIDTSSFVVYNFTSMTEGFITIQNLIPPINLGRYDSYNFDVNYYNFIFNNDYTFLSFFRIVQSLYTGKYVYIIFDEAYWSENLMESLLKIIQQRYGYNGYCVYDEDDVILALQNDDSNFNHYYGLNNLDIDKNRYQYLVKQLELQQPNQYMVENITNQFIG